MVTIESTVLRHTSGTDASLPPVSRAIAVRVTLVPRSRVREPPSIMIDARRIGGSTGVAMSLPHPATTPATTRLATRAMLVLPDRDTKRLRDRGRLTLCNLDDMACSAIRENELGRFIGN
jgi:hypothetical protein